MKRTVAVLATTMFAIFGVVGTTGSTAGAVTGPTVVLRKMYGFHFKPKALTVPDIGAGTCSASNYSFSVTNKTTDSVWLSENGQQTWFVPAHSSGNDFCFSAASSTPVVLHLLNTNGKRLSGKLTLTVK